MSLSLRIATAAALVAAPAAVMAAWVPGSEMIGQSATVQTGGVTNKVFFDPGGQARIVSQSGKVYNASWTASNGQLCLYNGGAGECWPYTQPFQAGQAIALTSSCQVTSNWLADGTNPPPVEPVPEVSPERG